MTVTYLGDAQDLDQFHKARFVKARGQVIGVELRHRPGLDLTECGGSPVIVQWEPYGEARPLFTLTSTDDSPISVEPHISCPVCGDRGEIKDGKWVGMEPVPEGVHDEGPLAPVVVESKLYGIGNGPDIEKEERMLIPPMVEGPQMHEFVGRSDRWCEVCNLPDRNPIHIKGPIVGFDGPDEDEEPERELDEEEKASGHDDDYDWLAASADDDNPNPRSMRLDLLEETIGIVTGDRNNAYGPPHQDFHRTAEMVTAMWRHKLAPDQGIEAHDVALFVMCIKLSRLQWTPNKRDNWVDIAGYAACGIEAYFLTHEDVEEI